MITSVMPVTRPDPSLSFSGKVLLGPASATITNATEDWSVLWAQSPCGLALRYQVQRGEGERRVVSNG